MSTQHTLPSRAIPKELPASARLFLFGGGGVRVVPLRDGEAVLGRSSASSVVLEDPTASGQHARFERKRGGGPWRVVDLGSTNGTFVGGMQVDEAPLEHGSVIRVGATLVVLEIGPRATEPCGEPVSIEEEHLERSIDRIAASDDPVLILGPTGAGKGHAAALLAERSGRRGRVVHVNCAALPRELVESELFGHERGAFSGAAGARAGLIEEADGGTLFLDEIGTLDLAIQAKLLVALESGVIRRVGGGTPRRVDVRTIAATNLDVDAAIASGQFRADLYYRLAVHTLTLPALAQRRPDIPRLLTAAMGLPFATALTPEAREALLVWSWPGNVRELLNVARSLRPLGDPPWDFGALPEPMARFLHERAGGSRPVSDTMSSPLAASRSRLIPPREELVAALADCDGNVTELARRMGKHRNQLVRWLDAYGLR
ncbi:MAG: sigma 54-interacting transcriptional regulator [Myxococcales bacterium]|nr:sigma 54-interacting transcriptional regulator [Myxococcales bacterium]